MLPDAMLKGPPIDMSTVEKLGAEIAQGRYPVDPERIAAAICRECFDFSV
jgi:anti-sigma28 factor (negative regulator of flagellin synthesis)